MQFLCSCLKKKKVFSIWGENDKIKFRSKLKSLVAKPLFTSKGNLSCLFCLGERCKAESAGEDKINAVAGLNSDFITSLIIVSQRPSTTLISKHNLLYEFKKKNIGAIINLQNEGEHPYCGPNKGLESSGFTYFPEIFMSELIDVHLEKWKDLSKPESIGWMQSIMSKMHQTILGNKTVFVHCHSGNKRSCLVVGCYLIYTSDMSCTEIVTILRAKRLNSDLGKNEVEFMEAFKEYIDYSKVIFTPQKHQIWDHLKRQNNLPSEQLEQTVWMPKLIVHLFQRIIKVKEIYNHDSMKVYLTLATAGLEDFKNEDTIVRMKKLINLGMLDVIENECDLEILSILMVDWLEDCVTYVIDRERLSSLYMSKEITTYIDKFKNNSEKSSKYERKQIFNYAKLIFSNIEIEIILCFSQFLAVLPPGKTNMSEYKEYIKMQNRLSTLFLGIDQSRSTKIMQKDTEEVKISISPDLSSLNYFDQKSCSQLTTLFEIIVFIINNDIVTNEEFFNPSVEQQGKLTITDKQAGYSLNTTLRSDKIKKKDSKIKPPQRGKRSKNSKYKKQENVKESMKALRTMSNNKIDDVSKIRNLIESYLNHNPMIILPAVPDFHLFTHEKLNSHLSCCHEEFYSALEDCFSSIYHHRASKHDVKFMSTSMKSKNQKFSTCSVQISSSKLKQVNSGRKDNDSSSFISTDSENEEHIGGNGNCGNDTLKDIDIDKGFLDSNANLLLGQPRRRSILFRLNNKNEIVKPTSIIRENKENNATIKPAFNSLQSNSSKANIHLISPRRLNRLISESDSNFPRSKCILSNQNIGKVLCGNIKNSHANLDKDQLHGCEIKTIKFEQRLENLEKQKRSSVLSDIINCTVKPKQRTDKRYSIEVS